MRLRKLILRNFRSFGPQTAITVEDFTVLIGANSSGKSAVMQALAKMFGQDPRDRVLQRSDFHLPKGMRPDSLTSAELSIEAQFEFPELLNPEERQPKVTVPPVFEHMVVEDAGGMPYVRIRLTATWTRGLTPEGDIDAVLQFITVPESVEETDGDRVGLKPHQRSHIQVIYVPAIRDPLAQLKHQSGALLWRVLNAVKWSESLPTRVQKGAGSLNALFTKELGFKNVSQILGKQWNEYHDDRRYGQIGIGFSSADVSELLKRVELTFRPTEVERDYTVDQLGEGLRSLFYFSLVSSLLELEAHLQTEEAASLGLTHEGFPIPALTILAVEEPENHLSPHLLGRVAENLLGTSRQVNAQVILSSHTPAMLRRIDPSGVRHLRVDPATDSTVVSSIRMPEDRDEAHKYVREAVQAYPELYFARLVVLGEGDSEEIILPKVLETLGSSLDRHQIAVVPLGGRHVNHFWRLLTDLQIPFVTLLDLDRERDGGGWGRIKYAIQQLLNVGVDRAALVEFRVRGRVTTLSDAELAELHLRPTSQVAAMDRWIRRLSEYGVFFSSPLDLDFLMLKTFPDAYKACAPDGGGPRLPSKLQEPAAYRSRIDKAVARVLKENGEDGRTYSDEDKELFVWYGYLFLGRGKPSTHIAALGEVSDGVLQSNLPAPLKQLRDRVHQLLGKGSRHASRR